MSSEEELCLTVKACSSHWVLSIDFCELPTSNTHGVHIYINMIFLLISIPRPGLCMEMTTLSLVEQPLLQPPYP